mgnify:CR=1 FL=1
MSDIVIETEALTKEYDGFVAVDHLDLVVNKGEIFGLLGPNGAGKTTTILMLLGLTEPTNGTVRVLGLDPSRQPLRVKARVGYLPDQVGFYDELTSRENLIYIAKLNGIPRDEAYQRIDRALERVGLADVKDHRVSTFSRGMRQRLGVAELLIKQPEMIILDEPTQGLDPDHAREFLHTIRGFKEEGITILLASHLLHQVQEVCDRVGLFHQGKMVLVGSVPELAKQVLGKAYRIYVKVRGDPEKITHSIQSTKGVVSVHGENGDTYIVESENDLRAEIARAVVAAGGSLYALDIEPQSLDAIYARFFQEVKNVPSD